MRASRPIVADCGLLPECFEGVYGRCRDFLRRFDNAAPETRILVRCPRIPDPEMVALLRVFPMTPSRRESVPSGSKSNTKMRRVFVLF